MNFNPYPQHLRFMAPLSAARADELLDGLLAARSPTLTAPAREGAPPPRLADAGCGWAALLIQALQRAPALHGLGIDLKADDLAHARQQADRLGVGQRLTLVQGPAAQHLPDHLDGALCIGATHVWAEDTPTPAAAPSQPLPYRAAFTALRRRLPPGAPLVWGDAIWQRPPTPAATAVLGGRDDEFLPLPQLLDLVKDCGFALLQVHQASQDEWDAFESGYTARYAHWLAQHPADHPDRREVLRRAQQQHEAYFGGYRGVLGMAYLVLLAV